MELVKSLLMLLAGVGIFIVGMNMMGDGLEKGAGKGLKRLFAKIGLECEDTKVIGKENKEIIITGVNVERSKCSLDELKLEIENTLQSKIEDQIFTMEGDFATVMIKTKNLYSTNDFYNIQNKKFLLDFRLFLIFVTHL